MGIRDAGHVAYHPDAATLLIVPVACRIPERAAGGVNLAGKLRIAVKPGSVAARIYRRADIAEEFHCNNGLNPAFQDAIDAAGLRVVGTGDEGEARIVELPDRPFHLATMFMPQLSSTAAEPHPLVVAFLRAAGEQARRVPEAAPARRG
ncbi:MAG: hypothetical protein HY691_06685 [Chloroflexi bacterium]|nr:hypothetical protein [Chloroflexota bacterium]